MASSVHGPRATHFSYNLPHGTHPLPALTSRHGFVFLRVDLDGNQIEINNGKEERELVEL